MPSVCCAVGCKNNKSQKNGIIFYNIPKDPERRLRWIAAIARENWSPNNNSRLCSQHFVSGTTQRGYIDRGACSKVKLYHLGKIIKISPIYQPKTICICIRHGKNVG
uniref:THAP domain-containing protein 1 n=1 Tax=Periophthalmus magnuspinnatus TaxID=409849 RepID=A0A3B4ALK8_9GOBI